MPIKRTHIATNKHTGERIYVELTKYGQYQDTFMTCLHDVEKNWDIVPVEEAKKEVERCSACEGQEFCPESGVTK